MSEKTKEDVFEELLESYAEVSDAYTDAVGQEYYAEEDPDYRKQFADALPYDLPVLPEVVGDYIKRWKADLLTEPLFVIFLTIQHNMNIDNPPNFKAENWIIDHGDTFARAWLLEVWKVEETGKVVRL